jgi:hypothetical protein
MDSEDKKPVVGKSMLDEFLDEWNEWRGKRKAKKEQAVDDMIHKSTGMTQGSRIRNRQKAYHHVGGILVFICEMLIDLIKALWWPFKFLAQGVFFVLEMFMSVIGFFLKYIIWFVIIGYFWFDVDFTELDTQQIQDTIEKTILEMNEGMEGTMPNVDIRIKKTDGTVIEHTFGQDETPPPLLPDPKEIGQ